MEKNQPSWNPLKERDEAAFASRSQSSSDPPLDINRPSTDISNPYPFRKYALLELYPVG